MRVILHPGFHKTGTSSLQACLAANRAALAPYCRIVLQDELTPPLRHATRFCLEHDPLDLASFTATFAETCQKLAREDAQTLVMSCEGLSGRTPGKNGVKTYAAAPPLAFAMQDAIRAVWGRKTDLTLLYTTRDAESWLSSAWRHNLWGYRVTEDFPAFREIYGKAADFTAITSQISAGLKWAQLQIAPLHSVENAAAGPAEAILRLLPLPEDLRPTLINPGLRNNGRSEAISAAFLALNRSGLSDDELKRRKAALLRSAAND